MVDVSVVIPVKNGLPFIQECLDSLLQQDFEGVWEISIYDDGSTDGTLNLCDNYRHQFMDKGIFFELNHSSETGGVGFAKNRAVRYSSGRFICFCDADDVSAKSRIRLLYKKAIEIVAAGLIPFLGSNFHRMPENSTERYTRWANSLTDQQLFNQIYTSHGPTLIAPTWFIPRELFNLLNGFTEIQNGYPEDLDFFYRSLAVKDLQLCKVQFDLVGYRYHPSCASFGVAESAIFNLRMRHLRENVLPHWPHFTIWSAGKQGKCFFKALTVDEKRKVKGFCDIDVRKIRHGWYEHYDETLRIVTTRLPVVHVKAANPPLIVCVKLDMTGGDLEALLNESGWLENRDYILFS